MKKIEASTLEEAYTKASKVLECSISELHCEVVQHPSNGILGFLKKNAIIMAKCKNDHTVQSAHSTLNESSAEKQVAEEILSVVKEEYAVEEDDSLSNISGKSTYEKPIKQEVTDKIHTREKESDENNEEEHVVYDELALRIENELKELFSHACFDIDVIEVDVRDNTALIFIDGEDAALLIGKEGYRYNALSYMLFSWLHTKYELFISLEIAEFLTKQKEMIASYILPVIETVESKGRARTRVLDGVLVQIALEQLRVHFPHKYVAVKTTKDGKKFVVINDFNNKNNG